MRKLQLAGALSFILALPYIVHAELAEDWSGLSDTGEAAFGAPVEASKKDISLFIGGYIIAPILGLVGFIFFTLMIYGGILWMTAAGNGDQIKKAQEILKNGFIGLIVIVTAYAVTNAVLNAVTMGSVSG